MAMSDDRMFGRRLRETRVKAGFSQSDLEELSGIPKARLSRYENGHVAPSIQTLERLARALGVSEASLLDDDRALMEEFLMVLQQRGVRIDSSEQAVALGNAVADILRAFRAGDPVDNGATEADPAMVGAMASVREWLDGQS
jgi:transcriptional regulator with XRE-family HTH domain